SRARQLDRRTAPVDAEINVLAIGCQRGIAECARNQLPRALDDVHARLDRHTRAVEEAHRPLVACAVSAIAQPDERAARPTRNPCALDQSLAVDHQIVPLGGQRAPELPHFAPGRHRQRPLAPAAQRKRNRATHAVDELDELDEALLDQPVNNDIGIAPPNIGNHRHVVNDVAQRRQANDQDLLHVGQYAFRNHAGHAPAKEATRSCVDCLAKSSEL
ncbi:hypothetical protein DFQ30_000685, partial [Apophysomyces sp. BC1015]